MKKYAFILGVLLLFMANHAWAQINVSGKVFDAAMNEPLAGVNIIVKGKVVGTISDGNGDFQLTVNEQPPITLVFSFIGFETKEIEITQNNVDNLTVNLEERTLLGQEIVVSASRVEETILESPVSIEKMGVLEVQNTSSDSYYKAIANLKGVDIATSSINFQIINTRGFASTGNTRFVQLIDGMDTQAPALNFPIGNLNGPSELDVESVELIPGASSALYGPNAFNGILLINSKSPFEYQGISAMAQLGVNHVGENAAQGAAPMYTFSFRYADDINDKFAYKVNFTHSRADDWHGRSDFDRNSELNPFSEIGGRNPGSDLLHEMGDEAAINLSIFQLSSNWRALARSRVFAPGVSAESYAGDLPSHVVSVTPYEESTLIDYGAENTKFNAAVHYRVTDDMELSYMANYGWGTSIYTGAQRYSLSNFSIGQHRLQLEGDNFFVRGYATMENSGDSYITEFLAKRMNDISSGGNVSTWLATYGVNYLEFLNQQGYAPGDVSDLPENQRLQVQLDAHNYARDQTENAFTLTPGTDEFENTKEKALSGVVPFGPRFNDRSNLYHAEGQYDFKNQVDFMELIAGASFRMFDLNSNGTIFDDEGGITIKEFGAYAQAAKWLLNDRLKLTTSLRYDKNENFEGQFNPRISGVFKVADNHNIRASYQTGFRIPTTQGQYINLDILSARLLGGLPEIVERYQLNDPNAYYYTGESVRDFTGAVFNSLSDGQSTPQAILGSLNNLERLTNFDPVVPEEVQSIEFGYKSLIENKLMIDAVFYYNIYNNFITQIQARRAPGEIIFDPANDAERAQSVANASQILNGTTLTIEDGGFTGNTIQIYTNEDDEVTSQGAALGLTYSFPKNYTLSGNYNWNVINDEIENGLTAFNTPEHKFNISFSNRKLTDKFGFNLTYRWQDAFLWESSFAVGPVPSYSTLDAQVSYKIEGLSSILKLGGSNLFNNYYIQSLGGPDIGAIYYISLTFNELMN
ncbi:MAG: TonB-dependent receptor [Candidatus Cyclobacteriaceae bacterium M2_1C_046]